jgi:18S rRNA (guanine1575-N7)-methyltransferase
VHQVSLSITISCGNVLANLSLPFQFTSISVLQWLLNADTASHSPPQRLNRFFTTLHSALRNPSRAVFQFYPSSDDQVTMITTAAQRAGFGGGVVVDYPNSSKKRKMYLCLMVGQQTIPKGLGDNGMEVDDGEHAEGGKSSSVKNEAKRRRDAISARRKGKSDKSKKGTVDKQWILDKKALYRQRGKEGVPRDSKVSGQRQAHMSAMVFDARFRNRQFTARKRKPTF